MAGSMFQPGSFYDNLNAVASQLGFKQPGVVWGLAKVRWRSTDERDQFLQALTARDYFNVIQTGQGNNG